MLHISLPTPCRMDFHVLQRAADLRRDARLVVHCRHFVILMVYFPDVRYRVPMEFVLLVDCAGLDALARRRPTPGSVTNV